MRNWVALASGFGGPHVELDHGGVSFSVVSVQWGESGDFVFRSSKGSVISPDTSCCPTQFELLFPTSGWRDITWLRWEPGGMPSDPPIASMAIDDLVVSFADSDGDGIEDAIDTDPKTYSNDFSDVPIRGTTFGTIDTRGDQDLIVIDSALPPPDDGVRIATSPQGGPTKASIIPCGDRSIRMSIGPDSHWILTCSTPTVWVLSGTLAITVMTQDGRQASLNLQEGNGMSVDPANGILGAPAANTLPVVVSFDGADYALTPGGTLALGQIPPRWPTLVIVFAIAIAAAALLAFLVLRKRRKASEGKRPR